jgi:uncharacterized protein (TIGR03437 family)
MELRRTMRRIAAMTVALLLAAAHARSADLLAPSYSQSTIVNTATQTVQPLAPNAVATIYGSNLSFATYAVGTGDVRGGSLPTTVQSVTVMMGGFPCGLYYVSPGQINFVVPYPLAAGNVSVVVARSGLAGPVVTVPVALTSPGLFMAGPGTALAVHLSGAVVSDDAPAKANEIIVLYADGLGWTSPDTYTGRIASGATSILASAHLQVLLNGTAVPAQNVLYAGLAPGYAGLYQINLKLPDAVLLNPEIRISAGGQTSPALVRLAMN